MKLGNSERLAMRRRFFYNTGTSSRRGLLPIDLRHATHVELLPEHHKYPFDRLLAAQSILEGMPLVSVDDKFDAYKVQRLW